MAKAARFEAGESTGLRRGIENDAALDFRIVPLGDDHFGVVRQLPSTHHDEAAEYPFTIVTGIGEARAIAEGLEPFDPDADVSLTDLELEMLEIVDDIPSSWELSCNRQTIPSKAIVGYGGTLTLVPR